MTSDADTLRSELRAHLPDPLPRRLGVAVSGGSDSTALLRLLADIGQQEQIELFAATVDHGLRSESASEALTVSALAQRLGIPHETLNWQGWDGAGNLQDQARRARYRLLVAWAEAKGIEAIALGHTADDQAETVLMRLARSAGVSGLSAMAPARKEHGITLLRPMLALSRAQLRTYLTAQGISWIDDPSNQDQRFDRIKARRALSGLDQIGITAETLSRVADNLAQAREALAQYTQDSAARLMRVMDGDLRIDRHGFDALPKEIRRRLVVASVSWIAGAEYPPRRKAVDQVLEAISSGQATTLGGCILIPEGKNTWICRELNAVRHETTQPAELWDRRWRVTGPEALGAEIHALGEDGILQLEDWRLAGKPRAALLSTPAVWVRGSMVAAPLAGFANDWKAEMRSERADFAAVILSH
ncbi:tRNA(Ile)-lysidine synthase [Ruegeria halocynthiae]|uniref:tRNA(Ile)-lysidine synthase n=1 Tax=Ruegeria halocynthiae TaxID=985054 RepID=A0A1H3DGR7_9RHOB|nr:tRNA lysidine(34) synthetase TilS [Ruegeria halocynthiae]SDX65530.1 tRNA(Ile)-lysidine synthase [Ruegeria halocynthiae]